jgi:transposase-like protein
MSGVSTMDEVLKQDSLGRVRIPLEKRIAIVEAFEGGGMSAARFARHHGLNYSTLCSWIQAVRSQRRENPAMHSSSGGASGDLWLVFRMARSADVGRDADTD